MTIAIDISVGHVSWEDNGVSDEQISQVVDYVIKHEWSHHSGDGELSILITGDNEIQKMNAQYRKKDKPTNILSFPGDIMTIGQEPNERGYVVLGDLVLSMDTIRHEATEQGKALDHHVLHLLVHGLLHLLGYDHETDREASQMELKEISILNHFSVPNPYE